MPLPWSCLWPPAVSRGGTASCLGAGETECDSGSTWGLSGSSPSLTQNPPALWKEEEEIPREQQWGWLVKAKRKGRTLNSSKTKSTNCVYRGVKKMWNKQWIPQTCCTCRPARGSYRRLWSQTSASAPLWMSQWLPEEGKHNILSHRVTTQS